MRTSTQDKINALIAKGRRHQARAEHLLGKASTLQMVLDGRVKKYKAGERVGKGQMVALKNGKVYGIKQ